jgi:hypothetical protein
MKTRISKVLRPAIVMFGLMATVMTAQTGYAQGANQTCRAATLKGRYQFASAGFVLAANAYVPLAVAGTDILDGHGTLSSTSTLIVGNIVAFQNLVVPNGTYTVNKDCTGTLTLGASGVVLSIFVAPNGGSFDYVQIAPLGNVLAGTIRRVDTSTQD